MSGIKIAHCADLHIGYSGFGLAEKNFVRKAEVINSVSRLIDKCNEEKIDILCIAGDLFDDSDVNKNDVLLVKSDFQRANFKIFISPGNHDPYHENSVYGEQWPENVFIFKNKEMSFFEFPEMNLRVWGAAFTERYEIKNIFENFSLFPSDNLINICVIHADLSFSTESLYRPVTALDISKSGMDYIALGHIHKRSEILKSGNTSYAYSGSLEGLDFSERGEKGVYIGEISKNNCLVKFFKMCSRMYLQVKIDITRCLSYEEIFDVILKNLEKEYGDDYAKNIFKIILIGEISENLIIDVKRIEVKLSEILFSCIVVDLTEIEVKFKDLELRNDFRGMFIRKLAQKIKNSSNEQDKELYKKAIKLGLKSFEGNVSYFDN